MNCLSVKLNLRMKKIDFLFEDFGFELEEDAGMESPQIFADAVLVSYDWNYIDRLRDRGRNDIPFSVYRHANTDGR